MHAIKALHYSQQYVQFTSKKVQQRMIFHFYIKEYKSQTIKLKKQQQQQQSSDKHQHSSFFFMRNAKSPAGLSGA